MKNLGSTILLIFLPILLSGQIRFSIEAKGLDSDFILVEKPVGGKYIAATPEKILKGKKGRFLIETNDNTPGFMHIHFGDGQSVKVFLEPGMTNAMKVNMANFHGSVKFSGPQAAQNAFLHDLRRVNLQSENGGAFAARSASLINSMKPKDLYMNVLDNIEAEKNILIKKGQKKFSKEFLKAAATDITFYHIALFSKEMAAAHSQQLKGSQTASTKKWAQYWDKVFKIAPLNSTDNFVTDYYLVTLESYINDYKIAYLGDAIYLDPDTEIGEQYLEYDRLLNQELEGQSKEYAVANIFAQKALLGKNEQILYDLFQKFRNEHPQSEYLTYFQAAIAPIEEIMQGDKFSFPEGIHQLDEVVEINAMKELVDMFRGKVVYVDVWATWCSPCLFEFRQKKPLEKFIDGKEVVIVYISVDDEDRRERWQKIVMDNDLKGYHLLANYALRDELINSFGDGSNLALPHYMIYDKKGQLVDKDAKQPSQNVKLFQDLSKYID